MALVRAWANANGYNIGSRGRIRAEILVAYLAAHGGKAPETPSPEPSTPSYVASASVNTAVVDGYGSSAGGVARKYVHPELTDEIIEKARTARAAIVDVGERFRLYRDHVIPDSGVILLDWRVDKPEGSR